MVAVLGAAGDGARRQMAAPRRRGPGGARRRSNTGPPTQKRSRIQTNMRSEKHSERFTRSAMPVLGRALHRHVAEIREWSEGPVIGIPARQLPGESQDTPRLRPVPQRICRCTASGPLGDSRAGGRRRPRREGSAGPGVHRRDGRPDAASVVAWASRRHAAGTLTRTVPAVRATPTVLPPAKEPAAAESSWTASVGA